MEITRTWPIGSKWVRCGWLTCFVILLLSQATWGQVAANKYEFKNGKMYIQLSKNTKPADLDSFITQYDLSDLPLKEFLKTNTPELWKKEGWSLEKNTPLLFVISKTLVGSDDMNNPANRIIFTEKQPSFNALFPTISNGVRFGYNRFRNVPPFTVQDSTVTFVLRNNPKYKEVMLAGSFNNWSPKALPMVKTENGWAAQVKLGPGKYWYKFVVDGNWITDPDNLVKENDGRGNTNSVFFRPNTIFRLRGYSNAKRVYLAGSFNNWRTRDLQLQKTLNGWELPLYLAQGTHTYRFIVDGDWITDPDNKNRLPNEFNDFNSVIRLGNPYVFKLPGNLSARQVVLSGSFNNWREDELFMLKTDTGWELPYTLGPGNYQYKFKVDGKWLTDPANPQVIQNGKSGGNSFLIINPNYTFRLKGHLQAKSVYLAGDFNDWSPTSLLMKKEQDGWAFRLHLSPGKTRYKFIVDGEWIKDPDNKLWEQNEYGTGNSIIWLDR